MRVRIRFEPRDCWIGVFWRWTCPVHDAEAIEPGGLRYKKVWDVYICLVPMLPVHIHWEVVRERFL